MGDMANALSEELQRLNNQYPNLTELQKEAYLWGAERRICWAERADCTALANVLFGMHNQGNTRDFAEEVNFLTSKFAGSWAWVAGGLDPTNRHPDGSVRQSC